MSNQLPSLFAYLHYLFSIEFIGVILVYNSIIHHLFIIWCDYYPKSSLYHHLSLLYSLLSPPLPFPLTITIPLSVPMVLFFFSFFT